MFVNKQRSITVECSLTHLSLSILKKKKIKITQVILELQTYSNTSLDPFKLDLKSKMIKNRRYLAWLSFWIETDICSACYICLFSCLALSLLSGSSSLKHYLYNDCSWAIMAFIRLERNCHCCGSFSDVKTRPAHHSGLIVSYLCRIKAKNLALAQLLIFITC